jgi:hypothetical protein
LRSTIFALTDPVSANVLSPALLQRDPIGLNQFDRMVVL